MLNLIIQPSVGEINDIVACLVIDRTGNLPYEEGATLRFDTTLEHIHVFSGVISYDGNETMNIS